MFCWFCIFTPIIESNEKHYRLCDMSKPNYNFQHITNLFIMKRGLFYTKTTMMQTKGESIKIKWNKLLHAILGKLLNVDIMCLYIELILEELLKKFLIKKHLNNFFCYPVFHQESNENSQMLNLLLIF